MTTLIIESIVKKTINMKFKVKQKLFMNKVDNSLECSRV